MHPKGLKMSGIRQYTLSAILIFSMALPAVGALALYWLTDDPYLRPLGITQEAVERGDDSSDAISIRVSVNYGADRVARPTQRELRQILQDAFAPHTDAFNIDVRRTSGDEISMTFVVGPNRYGPYSPATMVEGMTAALDALKYTQWINRNK